jgi:DNA-binding transcriptional regulator YdaS (Cro superfamily)
VNAKIIIAELGGPAKVAKIVGGITSQAVSQWKRIPVNRCRVIAAGSGGAFTVHDLRPDIFGPAPSVSPNQAASSSAETAA